VVLIKQQDPTAHGDNEEWSWRPQRYQVAFLTFDHLRGKRRDQAFLCVFEVIVEWQLFEQLPHWKLWLRQ